MSGSLRRLGRNRLTPMVLAVAWIPYLTMRCLGAPGIGGECNVLAALFGPAVQHHARQHATGHRADAPVKTGHDHCDKRQPSKRAHACCETTSKFNATVSATEVSVQPTLVAALPVPVLPPLLGAGPVFDRFSAPVAHSPPVYLRHLTLLI